MSAKNCPICFGPAGDRADRWCEECVAQHVKSMETPGSTAFIGNIPQMIGEGLPEIYRLRLRGALQQTWDYLNRNVELQDEFRAALDLIVDWARMKEATAESRFGPVPRASEDMLRKFLTCTCDTDKWNCPIKEHQHALADEMGRAGAKEIAALADEVFEADLLRKEAQSTKVLHHPDETCPVCQNPVDEEPPKDSRGVPDYRYFIGHRVHMGCWAAAQEWGNTPSMIPDRLKYFKVGNKLMPGSKS